jgi:hypothetical protein
MLSDLEIDTMDVLVCTKKDGSIQLRAAFIHTPTIHPKFMGKMT